MVAGCVGNEGGARCDVIAVVDTLIYLGLNRGSGERRFFVT